LKRLAYNAVLDSGCSQHIVNMREWLHDFREASLQVGTANSKPLMVEGVGTVQFPIRLSDGSKSVVVLKDCLYAPSCPVNLFSVGRLADVVGWRIIFAQGRTVCWKHIPGVKPTGYLVLPRRNHLTYLICDFAVPNSSSVDTPVSFLVGGANGGDDGLPSVFVVWMRRSLFFGGVRITE
jgi:hypothetical protein